jgi:hypothetical protein
MESPEVEAPSTDWSTIHQVDLEPKKGGGNCGKIHYEVGGNETASGSLLSSSLQRIASWSMLSFLGFFDNDDTDDFAASRHCKTTLIVHHRQRT